eukprot:CAMPEP_0179311676 /NCGR_PEP_ID=MMETSP0797-20121207/52819_1 /TAXON_ID=47934 /ORGANISM="Dinophysis acuminata, Strain DAEP01" /LENGTH=280 /DNA_ID=CAMNT_0021021477 /DNA_START=63 /DNA_END=901 /DNA_ORIENTATION=-
MRTPSSLLRYLKNGAFYHYFRRAPSTRELHEPCLNWDVDALPAGTAQQSSRLRGLWLLRGCVDSESSVRIRSLFHDLHEARRFRWNRYEPGRSMMPLHASPALDDGTTARVICGLDVFGPPGSPGADPLLGWPQLRELVDRRVPGARELERLQHLPHKLIADFAEQPCLFLQAQVLECGAEVTPHRDVLPYGGDMIATAVLEGSSVVRVGPLRFRADAGDMYAIAHDARYDVEHEVLGAPHDRFSVTLRYGLGFPSTLPLGGKRTPRIPIVAVTAVETQA